MTTATKADYRFKRALDQLDTAIKKRGIKRVSRQTLADIAAPLGFVARQTFGRNEPANFPPFQQCTKTLDDLKFMERHPPRYWEVEQADAEYARVNHDWFSGDVERQREMADALNEAVWALETRKADIAIALEYAEQEMADIRRNFEIDQRSNSVRCFRNWLVEMIEGPKPFEHKQYPVTVTEIDWDAGKRTTRTVPTEEWLSEQETKQPKGGNPDNTFFAVLRKYKPGKTQKSQKLNGDQIIQVAPAFTFATDGANLLVNFVESPEDECGLWVPAQPDNDYQRQAVAERSHGPLRLKDPDTVSLFAHPPKTVIFEWHAQCSNLKPLFKTTPPPANEKPRIERWWRDRHQDLKDGKKRKPLINDALGAIPVTLLRKKDDVMAFIHEHPERGSVTSAIPGTVFHHTVIDWRAMLPGPAISDVLTKIPAKAEVIMRISEQGDLHISWDDWSWSCKLHSGSVQARQDW